MDQDLRFGLTTLGEGIGMNLGSRVELGVGVEEIGKRLEFRSYLGLWAFCVQPCWEGATGG